MKYMTKFWPDEKETRERKKDRKKRYKKYRKIEKGYNDIMKIFSKTFSVPGYSENDPRILLLNELNEKWRAAFIARVYFGFSETGRKRHQKWIMWEGGLKGRDIIFSRSVRVQLDSFKTKKYVDNFTPQKLIRVFKRRKFDKNIRLYVRNLLNKREMFSSKKLQEILKKCCSSSEKIPKLKKEKVELFESKLFKETTGQSKRKIEDEFETERSIFLVLCGIELPEEMALEIFSYFVHNKSFLDNIGVVNEDFYLLSLKCFETLTITQDNIYKIPLLVLRNVKYVFYHGFKVYKSEIQHFHKNTLRVKKYYFEGDTKKERHVLGWGRENDFFRYIERDMIKYNCVALWVVNLSGLVIRRKTFPNVTTFGFVSFCSREGKMDGVMKKETLEFLHGIKKLGFGEKIRNYHNYREKIIYLPRFIKDLRSVETLATSAYVSLRFIGCVYLKLSEAIVGMPKLKKLHIKNTWKGIFINESKIIIDDLRWALERKKLDKLTFSHSFQSMNWGAFGSVAWSLRLRIPMTIAEHLQNLKTIGHFKVQFVMSPMLANISEKYMGYTFDELIKNEDLKNEKVDLKGNIYTFYQHYKRIRTNPQQMVKIRMDLKKKF
jgi:hypothetical protein